uniref:Olfactory receptor 2A25-like n=1 Tax=Geotrypetes seraphini TaxID=260995 RepID=A0A6P8P668_GEOSA|nr:olfactory receptor 2A25-like [Geotrypetes seraphini]
MDLQRVYPGPTDGYQIRDYRKPCLILQNQMEKVNFTTLTEFIILGFPEFPELQVPLFFLFLLIYLIILMGNLTIITIVCLDSHLHTPMYFFLSNLSFLDISCTSVTLPKLLDILLRNNHHISVNGCFTQMYFFLSLASNEFLILSVMAYDRYVAICHPLCYHLIMNPKVCILLSTGSWILCLAMPAFYFIFLLQFSFCHSNEINHFFCDITALLKLSCSSTSSLQCIVYIFGGFVACPCFISTLTSYVYIISNILRIRSTEGRRKAFSTCSSHLTVVCLFYLTLMCLYMRPSSMQSIDINKFIAILHNTLIPMFNPVIYSLKNKDVALFVSSDWVTRNCKELARIWETNWMSFGDGSPDICLRWNLIEVVRELVLPDMCTSWFVVVLWQLAFLQHLAACQVGELATSQPAIVFTG